VHNYERFLEWVRILALFSAIFIADLIIKSLEHTKVPFAGAAALTGLLAIAAMHVIELLVTTTFDRAIWLRRVILGDEYIEGVWFDTVVGQGLYGLITIHIRDGKITTTGEQFDRTGRITATWEDYVVTFEGRTLRGIYRAPQFREGGPSEVYGFSTYIFSGLPGKAPNSYSGFFADSSVEARKCQLKGLKITNKQILTKLADPVARRSCLSSLMATFGVESYE
jgi:hypothetical protein